MKQRNINISEIARMAGVSKTTVSRVINNRPDVKPATKERVERIINESGYCPSAIAQAFSKKRSMAIGLVFSDSEVDAVSNPYYTELMRGVLDEAREKEYRVVLSYLMDNDCLTLVRQKTVDGLLVMTPSNEQRDKLLELQELDVPLVSTSCVNGMESLHYVVGDEYGICYKIVEHLISIGHRRIAFIGGPEELYSNRSRLQAYQDALQAHHILYDPAIAEFGAASFRSGMEIMNRFLNGGHEITAAIAFSDLMALGAKRAIEQKGLQVPKNILLASTDSTAISDYLDASLITIRQSTYERGRKAMEMLVGLIENRHVEKHVTMPVRIVIRDAQQDPTAKA